MGGRTHDGGGARRSPSDPQEGPNHPTFGGPHGTRHPTRPGDDQRPVACHAATRRTRLLAHPSRGHRSASHARAGRLLPAQPGRRRVVLRRHRDRLHGPPAAHRRPQAGRRRLRRRTPGRDVRGRLGGPSRRPATHLVRRLHLSAGLLLRDRTDHRWGPARVLHRPRGARRGRHDQALRRRGGERSGAAGGGPAVHRGHRHRPAPAGSRTVAQPRRPRVDGHRPRRGGLHPPIPARPRRPGRRPAGRRRRLRRGVVRVAAHAERRLRPARHVSGPSPRRTCAREGREAAVSANPAGADRRDRCFDGLLRGSRAPSGTDTRARSLEG